TATAAHRFRGGPGPSVQITFQREKKSAPMGGLRMQGPYRPRGQDEERITRSPFDAQLSFSSSPFQYWKSRSQLRQLSGIPFWKVIVKRHTSGSLVGRPGR